MEKQIEKKLKQKIESFGGKCFKLLAFHETGLPDRVCILPGGKIFFVETKTKNGGLSPRQKYVHKELRKLGVLVFTVVGDGDINKISVTL